MNTPFAASARLRLLPQARFFLFRISPEFSCFFVLTAYFHILLPNFFPRTYAPFTCPSRPRSPSLILSSCARLLPFERLFSCFLHSFFHISHVLFSQFGDIFHRPECHFPLLAPSFLFLGFHPSPSMIFLPFDFGVCYNTVTKSIKEREKV